MELNRKGIGAGLADGVYAPQPARTFKVDPSVSSSFGAGTPCKLAGVASNGMPVITPITATTDTVYCVVASNLRNNSFTGGDKVKGWIAGEYVWLEASAAITAGACVNAGTNGKVATQTAGNTVLGIAESSAAASGDLVAVRITSPYKVYGEATA